MAARDDGWLIMEERQQYQTSACIIASPLLAESRSNQIIFVNIYSFFCKMSVTCLVLNLNVYYSQYNL